MGDQLVTRAYRKGRFCISLLEKAPIYFPVTLGGGQSLKPAHHRWHHIANLMKTKEGSMISFDAIVSTIFIISKNTSRTVQPL